MFIVFIKSQSASLNREANLNFQSYWWSSLSQPVTETFISRNSMKYIGVMSRLFEILTDGCIFQRLVPIPCTYNNIPVLVLCRFSSDFFLLFSVITLCVHSRYNLLSTAQILSFRQSAIMPLHSSLFFGEQENWQV